MKGLKGVPISMFTSISSRIIPSRDQFRVFLEVYKDDVTHRFVGAGGKRVICLPHETSYGVGIENLTNRKCTFEIVIGDVVLGEFNLSPRSKGVIKRGSKHDKSLVFISNRSDIAEHLGLPDPKLLGSGEIFVSVRPQVVPVEERYSSRRNKGGSFACASANNVCLSDGMRVVSDGVKCMSKGGAVVMAAGDKMTESMDVDGSTVLGEATGQRFHQSAKFRTLGCHVFHFLLQVGDLDRNVVYNGHLDDDGSPLSSPSRTPYSSLV